jgi:hypothetical protein
MTPEVGEKALRENRTDMVVFGRALIADPDIPNKVADGKLEDIRPCIGCWECIPEEHHVESGDWKQTESIQCTVNAAMGHEREYEITPASRPRRVVIVGEAPQVWRRPVWQH